LNLPFSTSDYACPYIHAEGIAFDAESLWTAQNDHVIQLQSPILDDAYEPNDSALAALDFGPLSLAPLHEVLSMTNDADWFAFITLEAGTTGDFVKIEFDAALGNLDLCLYAASSLATPIGCSQAAANSEMLSLAGLPAGAYLVNVLGQQGAINPCYTLTIDPPASTLRSGDLTGDAQSDGLDIQPFIAALIEGSSDAAHLAAADFDNSGAIDPPDIPLFVDALLNG
jgi:hypothetical protein